MIGRIVVVVVDVVTFFVAERGNLQRNLAISKGLD
jgi:hypothetical protein